jgi:peptide/nickel transport system substrate-binding protein
VQVQQDFGNLDPAVGNDYTQDLANYNMYDNLVTQAPNSTIIPNVASSWSSSSDGKTYTFILNQGIKFHNGDVLNASDVVFSMQRMIGIGEGAASDWVGILNSSGVKALNASAVQMQTEAVYAPFVSTLSLFYIVDQQAVMQHLANTSSSNSMGDWGAGWMSNHDAGSGPYMLGNYQPGVSLTIDRFTGYWRGWSNNPHPFNTVTYTIVTSDATVLSLAKESSLDWVGDYLQLSTYQALHTQLGWQFMNYSTATFYMIKMNTQKAPLNNTQFRKAVALAFNYSALSYIFPGGIPLAGPIPQSYKDYNPAVKPLSQNLTAAKAALTSSGVSASSQSLTIVYVQGSIQEQQIAEEFQKDLSQIGLTVNIQPQTFLTVTQIAANVTSTPDFTIIEFIPFYPDADSLLYAPYSSSAHGTWISMEWFTNSSVDNLLSMERTTLAQSQRQQYFYQLQTDITQNYVDVYLDIAPYFVALSPHVGGYTYSLGPSFEYGLYNVYYKP